MVQYAFGELNLNKLYAKMYTINMGSWRAAEMNGSQGKVYLKKMPILTGNL